MQDSFETRTSLRAGTHEYEIFDLGRLDRKYKVDRLPFSLKILLENLLRFEDGVRVNAADIEAVLNWDPAAVPASEVSFTPSRVLMQDFTGVPAVVDLAAMRDAMQAMGGDPSRINPLQPAELVIDHSVQVDRFGNPDAFPVNTDLEYQRNRERYTFLRWGQKALSNFKVVPPETGIVHQVNLEHLARVVFGVEQDGVLRAYPDTLVGTDSHTTMINGLGVLGWGVGGIEAEAAMLGQPVTMLVPQVIGFELTGSLPEGATATDLVLTVVELLRKKGVVGKFVEFFGPGLDHLSLADRATIANMAPEYGATCGIFPIDDETLRYLRLSGRSEQQVTLVEAYARRQGMFRTVDTPTSDYTDTLSLDLAGIVPSLAGPHRPQDRVPLDQARSSFQSALQVLKTERGLTGSGSAEFSDDGYTVQLGHGAVVIAAITSCTNTSNPSVMIGAGLLARKARQKGLTVKPWVKTSLAPGSRVVSDYLRAGGLLEDLEAMGFDVVGYGCTTCIGNSGPLPEAVSKAIADGGLAACAVLSGNRNFEGRVHAEVRMNYLASPPLVVAYALTGSMDIDLQNDPLGTGSDGQPVYLRDVWPSSAEIQAVIAGTIHAGLFNDSYADVFEGDTQWNGLAVPEGERFAWDDASTYIKHPPYFEDMGTQPPGAAPVVSARVLALLGDSVTTDHISPAGAIKADSPAGEYLLGKGVEKADFNSYGSRRGNHEVMMRGTFANIRLRNLLAPGAEGGWTTHQPDGEQMSIFDAAMRYRDEGTPLILLAGKEYGSGSSRDWAAKGPRLLGVRAVIAESYERIHRSNLIGMGILPLQFADADSAASLGLDGTESYDIPSLDDVQNGRLTVTVSKDSGKELRFSAVVRVDTPQEAEYYRHGGILQYVLRELLRQG